MLNANEGRAMSSQEQPDHREELIAEINRAAKVMRDLRASFPHALKRWADTERKVADVHIALCDMLVSTTDTGAKLAEAEKIRLIRFVESDTSTDSAWRELEEQAEKWDEAIRDLFAAEARFLAYVSLMESATQPPSVLSILNPYAPDHESY